MKKKTSALSPLLPGDLGATHLAKDLSPAELIEYISDQKYNLILAQVQVIEDSWGHLGLLMEEMQLHCKEEFTNELLSRKIITKQQVPQLQQQANIPADSFTPDPASLFGKLYIDFLSTLEPRLHFDPSTYRSLEKKAYVAVKIKLNLQVSDISYANGIETITKKVSEQEFSKVVKIPVGMVRKFNSALAAHSEIVKTTYMEYKDKIISPEAIARDIRIQVNAGRLSNTSPKLLQKINKIFGLTDFGAVPSLSF